MVRRGVPLPQLIRLSRLNLVRCERGEIDITLNRPEVFMLTNAAIKAARPAARIYKLADAGGLYLAVLPGGTKSFRLKYREGGKERLQVLGRWPELGLADARACRDQARIERARGACMDVRNGKRPCFEEIARDWHERRRDRWSPEHAADVLASLERDVFPAIGVNPIGSIEADEVLAVLHAVEARGCIETARRLRERIAAVFDLAILLKAAKANPAAAIAAELSLRPVQQPQLALADLDASRALVNAVDHLSGPGQLVRLAHRFLALTAVRLGTLRAADWSEFENLDGDEPAWRIPPAKLKLRKAKKADPKAELIVPLSRQAVQVLRALRAHQNHDTWPQAGLLFPGRRPGNPIGEAAIGDLIKRAGFAGLHVPHGWRSTFSTLLNERWREDRALIDQALGHVGGLSKVEAAYNRAEHLAQRRDLFQRWADLLIPLARP